MIPSKTPEDNSSQPDGSSLGLPARKASPSGQRSKSSAETASGLSAHVPKPPARKGKRLEISVTPKGVEKPKVYDHELRTVGDIFNILTPDNMGRFCHQFSNAMKLAVLMRELARSVSDPPIPSNDGLKLESFKWKDDGGDDPEETAERAMQEVYDLVGAYWDGGLGQAGPDAISPDEIAGIAERYGIALPRVRDGSGERSEVRSVAKDGTHEQPDGEERAGTPQ